jgi:hypothetical protein
MKTIVRFEGVSALLWALISDRALLSDSLSYDNNTHEKRRHDAKCITTFHDERRLRKLDSLLVLEMAGA